METREGFNIYELERKIAVLEERMKTKQAEFKTDIAQLDARLASRDTKLIILMFAVTITLAGLSVAIFTLL